MGDMITILALSFVGFGAVIFADWLLVTLELWRELHGEDS